MTAWAKIRKACLMRDKWSAVLLFSEDKTRVYCPDVILPGDKAPDGLHIGTVFSRGDNPVWHSTEDVRNLEGKASLEGQALSLCVNNKGEYDGLLITRGPTGVCEASVLDITEPLGEFALHIADVP